MSILELAMAVLTLLLTPGPTNALVLLAGAERGMSGALRLVPAELAGYLVTVVPLALAGTTVLADHHVLRTAVTLAAAVWVAWLALKLWHVPKNPASGRGVDGRSLFVATLLNPKSLIFGLVLLPSSDRLGTNLAVFAGLVVLVAVFWAGIGAVLRAGAGQPRALVSLRRLASVWLAGISLVLLAKGVGA